jgi:hypothetical protein
MPDHGLGSFTRAQWWGIITTEVNLQKSKRSVDHPRNKPRMSFRGISDATTILYPFGAENRAKSSLLKPTTVVAGTTISAVKKMRRTSARCSGTTGEYYRELSKRDSKCESVYTSDDVSKIRWCCCQVRLV